ncbi:putative bifunctional diguanylate cyclase/phosphodiesterase [Endothiovibrio diazotrophicus]
MFHRPARAASFDSAFFQLPDTLLVTMDYAGRVERLSVGLLEVMGYDPEQFHGTPFVEIVHPDDREATTARLRELAEKGETARFPARCRHGDGRYVGLIWNAAASAEEGLIYASAHPTAMSLTDDEATVPDAYLDGLTGLPNRSLFLDRVEHTWQRSRRRGDVRFAVLQVGLDRFKLINESLGHRLGDLLLSHVGNALRSVIRPTDMVARLGGDEFALLLEDIRDASSTLRVVQRIQERLTLPFTLHEHEVHTSVSIGIAVNHPDEGSGEGGADETPDQYLRDADIAMHRAKKRGGAGYVVFDPQMHDQAVRRLKLEMDLRKAVDLGQLEAFYQPIVRLADGRLNGFEALARWRHPEQGLISPVEFIPVAEESGLIAPIGHWMIGETCRRAARWDRDFPDHPPLTVSVNLSPRQLIRRELVPEVEALLEASGFPAERLKLEITESAVLEDADASLAQLNRLKGLGIRLSLDDFGTGYSSLSYLHQLPIDVLKVDRSFVSGVDGDGHHRGFVETIIGLARHLDLEVICEGVESEEQARILREMGCDYAQGFLYSRPVAENEARILIASGVGS